MNFTKRRDGQHRITLRVTHHSNLSEFTAAVLACWPHPEVVANEDADYVRRMIRSTGKAHLLDAARHGLGMHGSEVGYQVEDFQDAVFDAAFEALAEKFGVEGERPEPYGFGDD